MQTSLATTGGSGSAWSPFRYVTFTVLWAATVLSNIGSWMQNAAAGWLMTTLRPEAFEVALVQAATTLPMFLFSLPAGALADIIDRRRFLIAVEHGGSGNRRLVRDLRMVGLGHAELAADIYLRQGRHRDGSGDAGVAGHRAAASTKGRAPVCSRSQRCGLEYEPAPSARHWRAWRLVHSALRHPIGSMP